jgi:hypothetical protein
MAQTGNCGSVKADALQAITSMQVAEYNNDEVGASPQTDGSGFFLSPSTVTGRAADITGFILVSADEDGKFEWSSPATVGASIHLTDLADVTITSPLNNQRLIYDSVSSNWINAVTTAVTQLTSITTGVTCNAPTGLITTVNTNLATVTSTTFTVTNTRVAATSAIVVSISDYSGTYVTNGIPVVSVDNVTAGTFDIILTNVGANALGGTLNISFAVL